MANEAEKWTKLKNLRDLFLHGSKNKDYWTDVELLELYDQFYAARVGWKWNAVLDELQKTNFFFKFKNTTVIDWGCGTGIATRSLVQYMSPEKISSLVLVDRSRYARNFAQAQLSGQIRNIITSDRLEEVPTNSVILLSHVINELGDKNLATLLSQIKNADTVIWVEPGAQEQSIPLSHVREELRKTHKIFAPCTHDAPCPILNQQQKIDWCHFFSKPPSDIFQDREWAQFSKLVGIDLHKLPYSFIVATNKNFETDPQRGRIIGRVIHRKGYAQVQLCSQSGLNTTQVSKRKTPEQYKALEAGEKSLSPKC